MRRSLDRLESDYRTRIDEVTGRGAPNISPAEGLLPLIHGLEWSVREEPWTVISSSKRLIEIMEQLATDVTQGLPTEAFSVVPQESWDRYIALCDKYTQQRDESYKTLRQIEKVWSDEVRPYLDPSKHHPD